MVRLAVPVSSVILACVGITTFSPPALAEPPPAARVVREEALRPQLDPAGRPLPLVAHWHRALLPLSVQVRLLQEGHPILPWMPYHRVFKNSTEDLKHLATLRDWNMPLTLLTGQQWEEDFYKSSEYSGLPIGQTGLADDLEGNRVSKVSPFSPIEPWRLLGQKWTDNASARSIQAAYPDPPMVLFISNNEAMDLRWTMVETSKTYLDRHGLGRSDEYKRKVVGDGWIERYSALFQGMRERLPAGPWRDNSRFMGYNSFAPDHFGRTTSWMGGTVLTTEERLDPDWYSWNGASKDLYDNHWEAEKTAFNLWSMQVEAMNLVFMKEAALAVQPNFWFETLFWDGDEAGSSKSKHLKYLAQGVEYTPELYGGWTQYSMWVLVPRVAREWRASDDKRESWWKYFEQIMQGVQRVHVDPVLQRFWRHGELVPNTSRSHPFNFLIPAKWASIPRWYHLSTSADPMLPTVVRPAEYTVQFPVWTLARVIGSKPNREWLIYGHAPLGELEKLRVTVPDYRDVELPRIAVGGSFYHLVESTGKITEVGLDASPLKKPSAPEDIRVGAL